MEGTCFLTTFGPTTISNNLGGVVVAGSTWVAEGDVTISGNSIENLPVSTEFAGGVTLLNSEWVTYGNVVISNNIGNQTAGGVGLTTGLWRSLGAVTISNNKAPQGGGNKDVCTTPWIHSAFQEFIFPSKVCGQVKVLFPSMATRPKPVLVSLTDSPFSSN